MKKIIRVEHTEDDRKYLQSLKKEDLLTYEEELELVERFQNNPSQNRQAFEKLLSANHRFVRAIAKSYVSESHPLEELMKVGNLGLEMAIKCFDPARGFKFSAFAAAYIRKAITHFLAS